MDAIVIASCREIAMAFARASHSGVHTAVNRSSIAATASRAVVPSANA